MSEGMRCSFYVRSAQCQKTETTLWEGRFALCSNHRRVHNNILRRLATEVVGRHANERIDRHLQDRAATKEQSVVYFIRAGHRIKIGRSINAKQRLDKIRANGSNVQKPLSLDTSRAKLLATMPGYVEEERALHEKFAHLREKGEWFRAKPELLDFIKELAA